MALSYQCCTRTICNTPHARSPGLPPHLSSVCRETCQRHGITALVEDYCDFTSSRSQFVSGEIQWGSGFIAAVDAGSSRSRAGCCGGPANEQSCAKLREQLLVRCVIGRPSSMCLLSALPRVNRTLLCKTVHVQGRLEGNAIAHQEHRAARRRG